MTGPRFSADLRATLALAAPAVRAATAALWQPAGLRARYLAYLGAMHALIRASVPLMELAADRCARPAGYDPVAEPLGRYLREHAEEERGHDDWLLADIAAAGGDPGGPAAVLPSPVIAAMAGAQYYWIEHHHPVALLGYIAVLEGNAPAPGLADRLAAQTALPAAAFRTLRDHAALDTGHLADLDGLLDRLPLSAARRTAVRVSALHTVRELARLFRDLATDRPTVPSLVPGGPT